MTIDVFGTPTGEPVDYIAYAKDKFKNEQGEVDLAKLARAKWESDKHIERLQAEQEELRGEVKSRIGLEEFLTKVNQPPVSDPNKQGNQPQLNEQTPVDIERLVETHLTKAEQERVKKTNRDAVNSVLSKVWGDNTSQNFAQVANQLSMSTDELRTLAERSPEAFYRITGVKNQNAPSVGTVPQGTVTFGSQPQTVRNNAYYRNLKKADPNSYFSAKVQVQMHEDASTLGEKFFA